MPRRYRPTSHEDFSHAEIDSLAYDWSRVADPGTAPQRPLKVFFPRTTEDVQEIVREVKLLRDAGRRVRFKIRGEGHSSNDLVLEERATVLSTIYMNRILEVTGDTIKLQAGAILAQVDAYLGERGLGLPVIGDHDHITAGGFASVGGVSPASHRRGLFIDTVEELEYVDWNGALVHCGRKTNPTAFFRVLGGTGRHGVIVTLTCRIVPVDKRRTILENARSITRDYERFLDFSERVIADAGDALMERSVWLDVPLLGKPFTIGQVSTYHDTAPAWTKTVRNRLAHGLLHGLGYVAGRLPKLLDLVAMYIGVAGIIWSPRYASIKNIEVFIDKILDSSVGDPSRMLIVFAPAERYRVLFRALYDLCRRWRAKTACFTFLSFYVKGIASPYLAHGGSQTFCELVMWHGIDPQNMSPEVLDAIVSEIDDLCIEHGAFRYMHTRTVKDDQRRAQIDANVRLYGPHVAHVRSASDDRAPRAARTADEPAVVRPEREQPPPTSS